MLDCSLRSRGSRLEAAAFPLSLADEERVCSFVRPGQRRAILGAWNPPPSSWLAEGSRGINCSLRSLRLALLRQLAPCGGARFLDARGLAVSRLEALCGRWLTIGDALAALLRWMKSGVSQAARGNISALQTVQVSDNDVKGASFRGFDG
jgi:hypothetical protein